MKHHANKGRPLQFSVLAYVAPDESPTQPDDKKIVVLITLSKKGQLEIRIHPELEKIVRPRDREYLESLFRDFRERAKSYPEALFRQVSALSVGPLINCDTGSDLYEHPAYLSLMASFKEIGAWFLK